MIQCFLRAAALRLKYQKRCSQILLCLNYFLIFMATIWFIGGLVFVGMDMVTNLDSPRLSVLRASITAFLIIFLVLILFTACVGIKVSKFKAPSKYQVAAYGLCAFLFVFVPNASFSGGLFAIRNVTDFD